MSHPPPPPPSPPPPIEVTLCSVDEAKQAVARYGACSSTVTVNLPSLVRLSHARLVYKELRSMKKNRHWKFGRAMILKQARSLQETLHQLWSYVGKAHSFLFMAVSYHARIMGVLEEDDDVDLPSLGVKEDEPVAATAALLSRVDAIADDPAAASAAILRGIYCAQNAQSGSSRAEALREALTAMEERFNMISSLAVWTTNHKPCKDLALSGHKMISALGVLSSAPDPPGGPDTSESIAARLARLQELKAAMFLFYEGIKSLLHGPVSFNFRPFELDPMSETARFTCPFIEYSSEDETDGGHGAFGSDPVGVTVVSLDDAPATVSFNVVPASDDTDEECHGPMVDGLPFPWDDSWMLSDGIGLDELPFPLPAE